MNKKIIGISVFAGLFGLASFVLAATGIDPIGPTNFGSVFTGLTTVVSGIIGGLSTIMVIIAGFMFLTSAGSPERIGTAKKALTYAIIGIVVSLTAKSIVDFVMGALK